VGFRPAQAGTNHVVGQARPREISRQTLFSRSLTPGPPAHQPLAAITGELVGMAADQGGNLRLDGLRQQGSRAIAQHLGQRIDECSWLGELEKKFTDGIEVVRSQAQAAA
jgi:hypothetical protein